MLIEDSFSENDDSSLLRWYAQPLILSNFFEILRADVVESLISTYTGDVCLKKTVTETPVELS